MTAHTPLIRSFFDFIHARQTVWHTRTVLRNPSPWTDDNTLRDFKFCNVYRQLDGGTVALMDAINHATLSPATQLFTIIAYRFFNRRDTIPTLFGDPLDPTRFDFKKYEQRLDAARQKGNLFSNAYLITAHNYDPAYRPGEKHVQILLMLRDLAPKMNKLCTELKKAKPSDGLALLQKYIPMVGPFLAGQILLDATYTRLVPYTDNDFLIVGPGAHWGLNIIFGRKLSKKEADAHCRLLHHIQPDYLKDDWMHIHWQNPAYANAPYLSLHDIQNSLCEFRKYWRLKNGEKAKRRYYKG